MANTNQSSTGIAVHPAIIGSGEVQGLKAFLKDQAGRGNRCYIMAPLSQAGGDQVLNDLEAVGAFKPVAEGGYGFTRRQTFFPRSEAVLAHHLIRANITCYVDSEDSFVGYKGFPAGTYGLTLGNASGLAPAFPTWEALQAFLDAPALAGDTLQSMSSLRTVGAAVYRLKMSGRDFLLNVGPGADRAAEKTLLDGMRDAGLPALEQVWSANGGALYADPGGRLVANANNNDLKQLSGFLASLDSKADALRQLPDAPDARFYLDSYVEALNSLWNRVLKAAQAGHKDVMFFMMTDLEQLRQDNVNHFFLWCKRQKWDKHQHLAEKERIFSPGQIGFHNCLLTDDAVVTLDAGDAGWDDPARLMADFFHNTEQNLGTRRKLMVLDAFVKQRDWDENFLNRFWAVSDLVAVEWILKHLSVVLPEEQERLCATLTKEEYHDLVARRHKHALHLRETHEPMEHICKHDQLLDLNTQIK